jgi:L,D-transpeptidase catalytic domain
MQTKARRPDIKMRSFLVAIAGLAFLASTAAQASVAITVDKDNQLMTVEVDGVARYRWPVSTGIPSRETPSGNFRAFRMEEDHFSKEFDDAPMPHSIFFTKIGHAIHGTDSESRLGTPASHGCVRLSKANAATLYALVQEQGVLKTTVTLTGSAQVALARNPRRANTAIARNAPAQIDEQQYSASGEPVVLTPRPQVFPGRQFAPQQRADDGYIYPADGSSTDPRYPAPRTGRQLYGAQVNSQQQAYQQQQQAYQQQQQQQYYNNNQAYYQQQPGAYQPRQQYAPPLRGYYQD